MGWNEETGDETVPEFVTENAVELTEETGVDVVGVGLTTLVVSVVVIWEEEDKVVFVTMVETPVSVDDP